MVWWYRKHYEKDKSLGPCPSRKGKKNAVFLDEFVKDEILSRDSDEHTLGRTVLLNLILRYRAPRTKLSMENSKEPHPNLAKDRTNCGKEPDAEDLVLQSLIWRAKCHGVLTSNYDMLLRARLLDLRPWRGVALLPL